MPLYIDQMNREVMIPETPQRIVSLVPSQTELLADLGLGDRVVGITKFCIHPSEWFRSKTRVGGTKQYHYNIIDALQPDLIIGNKEENEQGGIEYLSERYPVWISDINGLGDAVKMIEQIGNITKTADKATSIIASIQKEFQICSRIFQEESVAYFIWNDPMMVAGSSTFIDEMLQQIGLKNCFSLQERYPAITEQQLIEANPDFIFLSSEPYPFKEKHLAYFKSMLPNAKVMLVDGEYFSWYGSRLVNAPAYFLSLFEQLR